MWWGNLASIGINIGIVYDLYETIYDLSMKLYKSDIK